MSCLKDEKLRAYIDQELAAPERAQAGEHLAACPVCQKRLKAMEHSREDVARSLAELAPSAAGDPGASRAFARLQARIEDAPLRRRNPLVNAFLRHPMPAWGGAGIAALVILLAAFAPARSLGQRVLAMLRVEKVTVVPVDFNITPGPDTQALVRQVISNDVTVTLSPGKPQQASDAAQASALAGFHVRVSANGPAGQGAPRIGVLGEQAYVMRLDRSRINAILGSIGRSDLEMPASIDGQTISVHIPKMALALYGNCPSHRKDGAAPGDPAQESSQNATSCVSLIEAPSPIVSIPPDLNVNQLFQIGLEAAGMTPAQASAFCQTVDWKSTLVAPIPSRAASYVKERVDGVEGDLILSNAARSHPAEYELIWVKDGVIYAIHGSGDSRQALALASNLE